MLSNQVHNHVPEALAVRHASSFDSSLALSRALAFELSEFRIA